MGVIPQAQNRTSKKSDVRCMNGISKGMDGVEFLSLLHFITTEGTQLPIRAVLGSNRLGLLNKSKSLGLLLSQGFTCCTKRDIQLIGLSCLLDVDHRTARLLTNRDATHVANLDKQVPIS